MEKIVGVTPSELHLSFWLKLGNEGKFYFMQFWGKESIRISFYGQAYVFMCNTIWIHRIIPVMLQTWKNYTFNMDLDVKHNACCGETIYKTQKVSNIFLWLCNCIWIKHVQYRGFGNLCCHAFIQYFCIICCTW